jgi:hypothetical protein
MTSQPSMFGEPSAAQPAASNSNYIQPTLSHGLRIWWAFFWRNTLLSGGLAFILGIELVLLARYIPLARTRYVLTYGGYVLEYITAIFIMHFIVRKKFQRFRIILSPSGDTDAAQILPATFRRTFRIWWTYTWRTVIYRVILGVAMSVPLGFLTGAVAVISPRLGPVSIWLTGVAAGGAAGLFAIYSNILDEDIAGFRVSLAPRETPVPAGAAAIAPFPGSV